MRRLRETVEGQGRAILMVMGVATGAAGLYALGQKVGWW